MLEGGLLKTQQAFKFLDAIFQDNLSLHSPINPMVSLLPLVGEDSVVLQDRLGNLVCSCQGLLTTPFGVCLNPVDLHPMSVPLPLSIINLKEKGSVGLSRSLTSVSLTLDSNFKILGRKQRAMVVLCWIA